jgi:hypothetical protein
MDASPSPGGFWKALLLKTEFFDSIGRSKTGLWLSLFVVAGLIASIGVLADGLAQAGQRTFGSSVGDRLSLTTGLRGRSVGRCWRRR